MKIAAITLLIFCLLGQGKYFAQTENITNIKFNHFVHLSEESVEIDLEIKNDSIFAIVVHKLPVDFSDAHKIDENVEVDEDGFYTFTHMEINRTERTYQKWENSSFIKTWLKKMETLDFFKIVNSRFSYNDGTTTELIIGSNETSMKLILNQISTKTHLSHWNDITQWIIELLNYFGLNGNVIIH
jgi:hypothetical protein